MKAILTQTVYDFPGPFAGGTCYPADTEVRLRRAADGVAEVVGASYLPLSPHEYTEIVDDD